LGPTLAAYLVGIRPLIEQRSLLARQRREVMAQRQQSSNLEASMLQLREHLATVQKELAQSGIKLESVDRINQRIARLTALFSHCVLEVDDVRTGKILTGTQCDLVPINIAGRGAYKQCVALLHKLHRTFADMIVARFELAGNPAKPEELRTFRFQLLWHAAPEARMAKNRCTEISLTLADIS
jgi:Tfp pilus assembly protein PilO